MKHNICGNRLRDLLSERGYTQEDLAEKVGMTRTSISKIVNGSNQFPKGGNLKSICKALNVSADYLLGLTAQKGKGIEK